MSYRNLRDNRHNVTNETFGYNSAPANAWTYAWHPEYDLPTAATDPEGGRVAIEYENALPVSLKLYHTANDYWETRFAYTGEGLLAAVTNANNHRVHFAYDQWGFPTSAVPQIGPTVRTTFTRLGHLAELRLPGPNGDRVTTLDPDELGRVRRIDYPDGLYETMAYDPIGNLTNHTDRAGRRTDLVWRPARNLASVTRYLGEQPVTISFDHDQQFNTLHITDPLDRLVEAYALDIQARPVAVTNLEGQVMTVTYGLDDMVLSVDRFDGTTVSNSYNSAGLLSALHHPGGAVFYSWLGNGLPLEAVNDMGSVSNAWNLAGRLTAQTQPVPAGTVTYTQDPVGNVTGTVSVAGTVRYAFDAAERLSGIQTDHADFAATYNPYNGLLAQTTNATTGIFVEYAYSDMDALTNIVWRASDGSVLRSFAYGYNAASMITNIALETGARIVYSYDDLDRLAAETRTGEPGTAYEYDLAGNRMRTIVDGTTNTYNQGQGNRLASWTGGSYSHDAAGCVTNIARSCLPDLDLAWNGLYQVESVATNGATAESYGYDALGRRIYVASGGTTNWMVYDGIHVVAEVDGTGTLLKSYVWGAGIDNLLAFTDHTGGATNTYFALTDHLGTVHAIADETGSIVELYKYDAWGNVLGVFDSNGQPIPKSAVGNRYLFQGREYSWATGLYYFRARWYDPIAGRWLSKDPIGINGGLNQYVAFDNNPVMFVDPLGLCDHSRGEVEIILSNLRSRLDKAGFKSTRGPAAILQAGRMHAIDISFFPLSVDPGIYDFDTRLHGQTWDVPGFDRPLNSDEFGNYLAGYSGGYLGFGAYWGARAGGIAYATGNRIYLFIIGAAPSGESLTDKESVPALKAGRAAAEAYKKNRAMQYYEETPFWRQLLDSMIIVF
jgi:RHS repeat-associated protein